MRTKADIERTIAENEHMFTTDIEGLDLATLARIRRNASKAGGLALGEMADSYGEHAAYVALPVVNEAIRKIDVEMDKKGFKVG